MLDIHTLGLLSEGSRFVHVYFYFVFVRLWFGEGVLNRSSAYQM